MLTGWQFIDGYWYYFITVPGISEGIMVKGWQFIDGYWYYFEPQTTIYGRPQGSLYTNGYTPDGYRVDASGAWIA